MRHAQFLLVWLVATLASGCSIDLHGAGEVVHSENHFAITGRPDVTVATFDGSIKVQSWDRAEVLVEIERRAASREDAERLDVQTMQEGNRVVIEAPSPRGLNRSVFGWGGGPSVSYTVHVPRRVTLKARTGDGSIAAEDLDGAIELRSGDGSIAADGVGGDLSAATGDGSIRIINASGRVSADSGDGSLTVDGRLDEVRAHSGDGSVRIEASEGSTMKSDWTIATGDGSVALRLPPSIDAEIAAHTGDGNANAHGAGVTTLSRGDDGKRLSARVGQGGRSIRIESGDGSIDVTVR